MFFRRSIKPFHIKTPIPVLEFIFRFFSAAIQVLTAGTRPCCRFTPSCSAYAAQAIHRHGLFWGAQLILDRLSRCRPGADWGSDPVPAQFPYQSIELNTADREKK